MSSLQKTTNHLRDEGTVQDASTGSTPRKRQWMYTNNWELTKNREELLSDWRSNRVSFVGGDTSPIEHGPLREGEDEEIVGVVEEEDTARTPTPPPKPASTTYPMVPDDTPVQLTSSESSTASQKPPPAARPPIKKSTISTKPSQSQFGTLTDARNVYNTRPRRHR
jgi:kinesin family member 11